MWQLSQAALVGICVVGFPVAALPLWQLAHDPGAMPAWLNAAGVHADVLWQVSQAAVVGIWVAGLPVASLPLWQLAQAPVTLAWLKFAGVHAEVR